MGTKCVIVTSQGCKTEPGEERCKAMQKEESRLGKQTRSA